MNDTDAASSSISGEALDAALPVPLHTLDLLPYGIVVLDESGTIVYYNPREEQISGRRASEVIGKNFFVDVAPCTAVRAFKGRFETVLADTARVVDFDFLFAFPTGEREVRISLSGFRDGARRLCLVAIADETERRRIQRQLAHQERLSAVGETAASVAHNFNNLLTAILGNAELALRSVDDPEARRFITTIVAAARDGSALVKRVQGLSRRGADASSERVDLNALVADTVAFARPGLSGDSSVTLELDLHAEPIYVDADPTELREVLLNLVRNASDAIAGNGRVALRTMPEGARVRLSVSDTGCGIPPEVRERIFEPFFSTKGENGTGLGLATVFSTVRRLGGELTVESEVGVGTTMTVHLPSA